MRTTSESSSVAGRRRRPLSLIVLTAVVVLLSAGLLWIRSGGLQLSGLGRIATQTFLERLAQAPAADGTSPVTEAADGDQVRFLEFVVDDIQTTWQDLFASADMAYERTQLVLFKDATRSGCGAASAETGPFYCPVDERVYLDLGFFDQLATEFEAPGDFAQAYVVAHEFGHHVQNLLGITVQVAQIEASDPTVANDLSVRTELQADCLAGIWGHAAFQRSEVEPGDVEEGVNAASAVGDDRLQRMATGEVDPDTFTHGTSAQRSAWFLAGYQSGDPSSCDSFQRDMPAGAKVSSVAGAP